MVNSTSLFSLRRSVFKKDLLKPRVWCSSQFLIYRLCKSRCAPYCLLVVNEFSKFLNHNLNHNLDMRSSILWLVLSLAVAAKSASDSLQIGITTKIPEEECTEKSKSGDTISVDYRGTFLESGAEFDGSYKRDKPFTFKLGAGQVIKGWDQGLIDMCIGEIRKLTVPPSLAYGDQGAGGVIPGGATLVFDVILREINGGGGKDEL